MLLRRPGTAVSPAQPLARRRPRPCVAVAAEAAGSDAPSTTGRRDDDTSLPPIVVRSLGPPRTPGAPPSPPPVEHSTAYLLRNRGGGSDETSLSALTAPRRPAPSADPAAPFTGSAVEWALRRVDGALDAAEADPPPGAKVVLDVARGPAGAAAAGAAAAAARGAVALGGTALKAAIPVGKWALTAGAKAAVGLVVGRGGKKADNKK